MKITWLGQAGLLFETNNTKIMVDPYLSNSVARLQPENQRRVEVDNSFLNIKPDIIILTHNHLDHTDPETLKHFLNENSSVLVLASFNAWQEVRKFGGNNNYVMFNSGTVWSEKGITFTAVYAEHSDSFAIGVVLEAENKKYYVTGDTLYNRKIFRTLPDNIYCVFLPVNGKGNNMNMLDAEKLCEKIKPTFAVPVHCGLFDSIDMNNFNLENKIIPKIYTEIKLKEE